MKIWILTSRFGQGHYSAAKALEWELVQKGHRVQVDDIVEIMHPRIYKHIYSIFNRFICRKPAVYNFLNEFGRNPKNKNHQDKKLNNALKEIQPDMIITTWSACARKIGNTRVPTYVCITDLGVHCGWINNGAKGYLVACHQVETRLIDMGVDKEKIHIIGIPVKSEFNMPHSTIGENKKVLIMGGGLGILSGIYSLLDDLKVYPQLDVTVITGHNPKLKEKLEKNYPSVKAVGYTNMVSKYMAETDLFISKPGGVSLFESIYAETPYVALSPQYKHEIENAEFILLEGIGQVISSEDSAGHEIAKLVSDEEWLKKCHENMARIKNEIESGKKSSWSYENAV